MSLLNSKKQTQLSNAQILAQYYIQQGSTETTLGKWGTFTREEIAEAKQLAKAELFAQSKVSKRARMSDSNFQD